MRAVSIRVSGGKSGIVQMKASFRKNKKHYFQEAIGLGIFMVSACMFSVILESHTSELHYAIPNAFLRTIIMGILMGATALFIFYSRFTSPSGSHINPAVTVTFIRLNKCCPWDGFFYIIFQIAGGTLAVFGMQLLGGESVTEPPVNSAVTVPGTAGVAAAMITEFVIAFITMMVVLISSSHHALKKYSRLLSGCLVCTWVIVAGPISGFGMNPARSFASAFPANIWTSFWIYLFIPFAGMLSAAEVFLFYHRSLHRNRLQNTVRSKQSLS